ncbi:MAG: hypothetical protein AAB871_03120 [Patescibacteria group bacterium]
MKKYTIAGIVIMIILALRFMGDLGMAFGLFSKSFFAGLIYLILAGVYLWALVSMVRRANNAIIIVSAVAAVDLLAILINSRNFYGFGAAIMDLSLFYFVWKEYKNQQEDSFSDGSGASPIAPA